jgi:hypothetical protein
MFSKQIYLCLKSSFRISLLLELLLVLDYFQEFVVQYCFSCATPSLDVKKGHITACMLVAYTV